MTLIDGSNITIGYLGIVAGIYDKLEIGKYINEELAKKRHHHISHGTAVKTLTLNGLGYNESRLLLILEFYEDIAIERLLITATRLEQQLKEDKTALKKLCSKRFSCEPNARAVIDRRFRKNPPAIESIP